MARALGVMLLASAVVLSFSWTPAQAQIAPAHEVRKGDTLFGVARKARYDGVSRNQMILAILRANKNAFPGGNIHMLVIGTVLAIPARDEVAKIDAAEADHQVRELLAARPGAASSTVAAVKPVPGAIPARPSRAVPAAGSEAAKRYREGLGLERRGEHQAALTAFQEAGEAGNGLAQRKLGQIYDKGNAVVQRDYQTSLKWYQKAREQGIELDKPLQRTMPK